MAGPSEFRKVTSVDPSAVTVNLWKFDGATVGEITAPVLGGSREIRLSPEGKDGSLPAVVALQRAVEQAHHHNVRVVVKDDDNLWDEGWGTLF